MRRGFCGQIVHHPLGAGAGQGGVLLDDFHLFLLGLLLEQVGGMIVLRELLTHEH
jgi:hypothetical protein